MAQTNAAGRGHVSETLVRVSAPHFCAGLIVVGDKCTHAAPILRWAIGKDRHELSAYFKRKAWKAVIAQSTP
jgi:hypothetical protein